MDPVIHTKTRPADGSNVETRLRELGFDLPTVPDPVGNFELGVIDGNRLILSGQGPLMEDGALARGKVGGGVSTDAAYLHAQRTGLVLIGAMKAVLGDLAYIDRILRVFGMVNATPDYAEHPKVIDGCSDLFRDVFGHRGQHARCAIGVGSLPGNISVEIEATVAISPKWRERK